MGKWSPEAPWGVQAEIRVPSPSLPSLSNLGRDPWPGPAGPCDPRTPRIPTGRPSPVAGAGGPGPWPARDTGGARPARGSPPGPPNSATIRAPGPLQAPTPDLPGRAKPAVGAVGRAGPRREGPRCRRRPRARPRPDPAQRPGPGDNAATQRAARPLATSGRLLPSVARGPAFPARFASRLALRSSPATALEAHWIVRLSFKACERGWDQGAPGPLRRRDADWTRRREAGTGRGMRPSGRGLRAGRRLQPDGRPVVPSPFHAGPRPSGHRVCIAFS